MWAKKMGFDGYDWKDSNEVFEETCRFSRGSRKDYNAIRVMAKRNGMRGHDFLKTYGTTGLQAPLLIIDGKIVMENRKVLTIDEDKAIEDAQKLAVKLCDEALDDFMSRDSYIVKELKKGFY